MQGRGEKMRLIGDIYESNVFITDNALIVDAGANLNKVTGAVKNKKIDGVLLTHGHFDHAYFAMDYAQKYGVKIYASAKIEEYLREPKKNYSTDFEGMELKIDDFSNFVLLHGDEEFCVQNVKVKYFQLGGHSKSDMCFLVGDDLYVGDTIVGRGIGRMDLYGGNKQDMLESLKKISTLSYKTMHCGHGEDLTKDMADKVIATYIRFLSR